MYVAEQFPEVAFERSNRRFFPTNRDIRNHVNLSVASTRFSSDDQENLHINLQQWTKDFRTDCFFFRPSSVPEDTDTDVSAHSLLFVHQTEFQRKMLSKYGQEVTLMDATYNTTKYELPLFFVCVCSNDGYVIVASFIVGKETKVNIKEALSMLKSWNKSWKPNFFMTDFDLQEISALEEVFSGTSVYLCDFHRNQAWDRWLKATKNGIGNQLDITTKQLRKISSALTEDSFKNEVTILREMDVYKTNNAFSAWIEKKWLQESHRWVYCYRQNLFNIKINTTNGLEAQHCELKKQYLAKFCHGKTLTSMVQVLVKQFMPDNQERYIRKNVLAMEKHRKYAAEVPDFLQNRPKPFLEHCLKRMPPSIEAIYENQIRQITCNAFKVKSPFSGQEYTVSFRSEMPECDCSDWRHTHWPCKHLLAIFQYFPSFNWEQLPETYKKQPVFCLDDDVVSVANGIKEIGTDPMKECFDTQTEDQSIDSVSCVTTSVKERRSCLELVKQINNGLYRIESVDVLSSLKVKLAEIDGFIDNKVPRTFDGLPLRSVKPLKVPKKRPGHRKKMQQKSIPQEVLTDTLVYDMDLLFQMGEESITNQQYTDHLNNKEEKHETKQPPDDKAAKTDHCIAEKTASQIEEINEYKQVVEKMWSDENTGDCLGQVGPYSIYDDSIGFLKNTLSDEVIDAYLHILVGGLDNVCHINCVVMTAIFNGTDGVHGLLKKIDIYQQDMLVGAHNEGGHHWTLLEQ